MSRKVNMSVELKNQSSNRYIPLNNLHPILKDLYSTSSQSSEFGNDVLRDEPGNDDPGEEELKQVDFIRERLLLKKYNKPGRIRNLNSTANKLVEEVIRLAVEKLNSDSNSEPDEFFDAEENIGLSVSNNQSQVNHVTQLSVELVSDSSQTDLIVDPNEVLEIVDADDSSPPGHNEEASNRNEQKGTGGDGYCRVTTQCERCEVYMLDCYKYQCKCENLSIYMATLEKKVEEYVALLNNYNTRLMTSRLLIKQSNGKQNELMLRCDELQEKIRLHQALKEVEYRKKRVSKKRNKDYYVERFSKDFFDLEDRISVEESDLELVKELIEDHGLKDTFDKYKSSDGIGWEHLSLEKFVSSLIDLEFLEKTKLKDQTEKSGESFDSSQLANSEALKVYGDLVNEAISIAEIHEVYEKYKSIEDIDWSSMSDERFRKTLKDFRDLEIVGKMHSISESESEREISDQVYHEIYDSISSKDQDAITEDKSSPSFGVSRESAAYEEKKVPGEETKERAFKEDGFIDRLKPGKIGSEEQSQHFHEADGEMRKSHEFKEVPSRSDGVSAEEIKMTDGFKDEGKVVQQDIREDLREQKTGKESKFDSLEWKTQKKGESSKLDLSIPEESGRGLEEELEDKALDSRTISDDYRDNDARISGSYSGRKVPPTMISDRKTGDKDPAKKILDKVTPIQEGEEEDSRLAKDHEAGMLEDYHLRAGVKDRKLEESESGKMGGEKDMQYISNARQTAEEGKILLKPELAMQDGSVESATSERYVEKKLDGFQSQEQTKPKPDNMPYSDSGYLQRDDSEEGPSIQDRVEGRGEDRVATKLDEVGTNYKKEYPLIDTSERYYTSRRDKNPMEFETNIKSDDKKKERLLDKYERGSTKEMDENLMDVESNVGTDNREKDKLVDKSERGSTKQIDENLMSVVSNIGTDKKEKEPLIDKSGKRSTDRMDGKPMDMKSDITQEKDYKTDKAIFDEYGKEEAIDLKSIKSKQVVGEENYYPPKTQIESADTFTEKDSLRGEKEKMHDVPLKKDVTSSKIDEQVDRAPLHMYEKEEPDYLITSDAKRIPKEKDMPLDVKSESSHKFIESFNFPKTGSIKSKQIEPKSDHDSRENAIEKYKKDDKTDEILNVEQLNAFEHDEEVPIQKEVVNKTSKADKGDKFIDTEPGKEVELGEGLKIDGKSIKYQKADDPLYVKHASEKEFETGKEAPTLKKGQIEKITKEDTHLEGEGVEKLVEDRKPVEKTPIQTKSEKESKASPHEGKEVDKTKGGAAVEDPSETENALVNAREVEKGIVKPLKDGSYNSNVKRKSVASKPEEHKVSTQEQIFGKKSMKDQHPDELLLKKKSSLEAQQVEEQKAIKAKDKTNERTKKDGKTHDSEEKELSIGADDGSVEQETTHKNIVESSRDDKEPYQKKIMDKKMPDNLKNKEKIGEKKDSMGKEKLSSQDGRKTDYPLQKPIIDYLRPAVESAIGEDKSFDEKTGLDGKLLQKFEPKKRVQQDVQEVEIVPRERAEGRVFPSIKEGKEVLDHLAKEEDVDMGGKQKKDYIFSNIPKSIAEENIIVPDTATASELKKDKDKQILETAEREESKTQDLKERDVKKQVSKEDRGYNEEKSAEDEKPKKDETPTANKPSLETMDAEKQQSHIATGLQGNNKLKEQQQASDLLRKTIGERTEAENIKSIPTFTRTNKTQDKSDLLPPKIKMSDEIQPISSDEVLDHRKGDIEKSNVAQSVPKSSKEGPRKLEKDLSSTKSVPREPSENKNETGAGQMSAVSKDNDFGKMKNYPENKQEEAAASNRINISEQQSLKDDEVGKDYKPIKNLEKITTDYPENGDRQSKDKISDLERIFIHDTSKEGDVFPLTDDNIQDGRLNVRKFVDSPEQRKESKKPKSPQDVIERETSRNAKEKSSTEISDKGKIIDTEELPSGAQKLKDQPGKTVKDGDKSKQWKKQLSTEKDSIEDKGFSDTLKKPITSKYPDTELDIEAEKLVHQPQKSPSFKEMKVNAEDKGSRRIQGSTIATKDPQFVMNQGTQPRDKNKVTERVKSIESQLFQKTSSISTSKFPTKLAEKSVQEQIDERLRDRLSAAGKFPQKGSRLKDSDEPNKKQSNDNLAFRKSDDEIRVDKNDESKQQNRDGTQKQEGGVGKSKPSRQQKKLMGAGESAKPINTSDSRRFPFNSDEQFEKFNHEKLQESGLASDEKENKHRKEKGKLDGGVMDELDRARTSTVAKGKGQFDKSIGNADTNFARKEQGKKEKPTETSDSQHVKNKQIDNRVGLPVNKLPKKSPPKASGKRDENNLRKPERGEKQGKKISVEEITKTEGTPENLKGEAGIGRKREEARALGQPKVTSQVKTNEKFDLKLRKSASQKVYPKEIAARKVMNGKQVMKGPVQADHQGMKYSKSLPPQNSIESDKNTIEEAEKWKIKPTLLQKMKKYGIHVLTWDELDKLHDEVLVAMRAHHGFIDSETDETDIQNELQQLSPVDLGNLHAELSDFAENKRSGNKPLLSKSKSKILNQLAGGRAPPVNDNSDMAALQRKPALTSPDIVPRIIKLKIGDPSSSANQPRLGVPLVKDQNTSKSRTQNMNEPRRNISGLEIPESLRRRSDGSIQGRKPFNVQDRRPSQKKGNILEKLQQYMNDQSIAEKPLLKKKSNHECHCTTHNENIVNKCFCSH